MNSSFISVNVACFQATKNPFYIIKAIYLLMRQGRIREVVFGMYCFSFLKPSIVRPISDRKLELILNDFKPVVSTKDYLSRGALINMFARDFAVERLPGDFIGARIESVLCHEDSLIIGEYGSPGKRLAFVNRQACLIDEFYVSDSFVRHVHAIYKSPFSDQLFVTTGDRAKYLDVWALRNHKGHFKRRLKRSLAGHTAICSIGDSYYFGTDFSNRPNFIETLDGQHHMFPKKARKLFVIRFQPFENRYIASLSRELGCFGGRHVLSVFDAQQKEFVYCDYQAYAEPAVLNGPLHRTAILRRVGR